MLTLADLFSPAQVRWQSWPWPLKLITSWAVQGTRIRTGGEIGQTIEKMNKDKAVDIKKLLYF